MSTPSVSPLKGTGQNIVRIPTKSSEQMALINQGLGSGGYGASLDFLTRLAGGDETMFQQLEAPALRQFNQLQAQTASRFSGLGMGARQSSGHQNAQTAGAVDLAERLQSQRLGLQAGAVNSLMDMYRTLMGEDLYNTGLMEDKKKKKWWETALQFGLPIAGGAIGALTGGPMGLAMGAGLGSQFGNAFGGGESGQIDWSGIPKLPTKWS